MMSAHEEFYSRSLRDPDAFWADWPILTICKGVEKARSKSGSPGKAVYGPGVKLLDEHASEELTRANQKGVLAIEGPLPPGCMQTPGTTARRPGHALDRPAWHASESSRAGC